ncbi:hypothetical protein HYPBUDRAFT_8653 [Hyphopichia burtonii NRRL Y-1933]|uniref:Uncharacterized protein n=1 Tax=Hyphopichia burtonii NRRL Y-1933 TaxID=984485 RepID=A0A1E4RBG3_9ASCO|nr:hypothetical protein HYPBUDRAFT_8653 [Hyphopichia burtonii NRRL Y-1933]ODV64576.1 hypothetical protein HYPBUDRAFT_8653 [Hyphopichia burtonii NRRL Y-1933]
MKRLLKDYETKKKKETTKKTNDKRGPDRPKKTGSEPISTSKSASPDALDASTGQPIEKKKRGRPRVNPITPKGPPKKRGRPKTKTDPVVKRPVGRPRTKIVEVKEKRPVGRPKRKVEEVKAVSVSDSSDSDSDASGVTGNSLEIIPTRKRPSENPTQVSTQDSGSETPDEEVSRITPTKRRRLNKPPTSVSPRLELRRVPNLATPSATNSPVISPTKTRRSSRTLVKKAAKRQTNDIKPLAASSLILDSDSDLDQSDPDTNITSRPISQSPTKYIAAFSDDDDDDDEITMLRY